MEILYFTKYSRLGASSRLRSYQYFPHLEASGFKVKVFPLFSDEYLKQLYYGKVEPLTVLSCYIKRFFNLFQISKKTKVIIEKELFPYLPAWVEQLLSFLGIQYIVDYDDAIFHNYDKNSNLFIQFFLKNKIDKVMRFSKCVTVGNLYLRQRAEKAGAKCIRIMPTVIDLSRYQINKQLISQSKFVVGWIGSPSTFKYLLPIAPVLKKLAESGAHIHIIGAKGNLGFTKNVEFIDWQEESEIKDIALFNVGIMPLEDTLWEEGKCSYKLIQYMASKIPVVASPVGMNKAVVKHNVNGFLAGTNNEWEDALVFYKGNLVVQRQHGENGYDLAVENYTIVSQLEKLINIIHD